MQHARLGGLVSALVILLLGTGCGASAAGRSEGAHDPSASAVSAGSERENAGDDAGAAPGPGDTEVPRTSAEGHDALDGAGPADAPSVASIRFRLVVGGVARTSELFADGRVRCTPGPAWCAPEGRLRDPALTWDALVAALTAARASLDGRRVGAPSRRGETYEVHATWSDGSAAGATVHAWDDADPALQALIRHYRVADEERLFEAPPITAANLERVTLEVDGEEGEHAEVTVHRDGRVTRGPVASGRGSPPRIATTVRRVRDPNALFAALAERLASARFTELEDASGAERYGTWRSLRVEWAGRSRSLVLRSELGATSQLLHDALGLSPLGL